MKNIRTKLSQLKNSAFGNRKDLERRLTKMESRFEKLKELTLPKQKELTKESKTVNKRLAAVERRSKKPPFYNTTHVLGTYIDKNFSVEQQEWFIERQVYRSLGYFPDLKNPKTFNEKTNWYKLNYRDPLITDCIDKVKFKDFVTDTIGYDYVIPLYGTWDHPRQIDFSALPKEFVLKSNWGSGSRHVLLVPDKDQLDLDRVKHLASNWVQPWENVYYHTFDWGYKDIQPKILAEKYVQNKHFDYRFFCFNGKSGFFYVRKEGPLGSGVIYQNYYDMSWKPIPLKQRSGNIPEPIEKPKNFEKMLELAETLSNRFPHARVDLIDTDDGVFAEELTFYNSSGTCRFNPPEWDEKLGEYFILPKANI